MSKMMIGFGKPLAFAAALFAGAAATADATECVTSRGQGRVSLDCRAVPLGQVLRALSNVSPIDTKLIDSSAQATPIYVALPDGTVAQALQATLDAAGISFVLFGGDGSDLKVYASAATGPSTGSATRTASAPRPPIAEQEFVQDEQPDIEEPLPIPETKEPALTTPNFVPTPLKGDGAAVAPVAGSPGIGGFGSPGGLSGAPAGPTLNDPLRMQPDPAAAAGRPTTMEEILARTAPQGAPAGAAGEKQVFSTMEEILARTNPPKQQQ
jgi:hypothetical protein